MESPFFNCNSFLGMTNRTGSGSVAVISQCQEHFAEISGQNLTAISLVNTYNER